MIAKSYRKSDLDPNFFDPNFFNDNISYTSNWPHEPLVNNTPTASVFLWSIISIFLLLGGIGILVWYYAKQYDEWQEDQVPVGGISKKDLLEDTVITPSMHATKKYFWTVVLLMIAQVLLGSITAHYGIDGQDFYGFELSKYLPYSVARTWHVQLAIIWILTAWLATDLYMGPLISKYEPKLQSLLVNLLFVCLIIIVVGSFAGEWLGINQFFTNLTNNFWFGHQGYVLFWNFVGAGLFEFLINPPIALYYMQGLYTTAVHAHTALFGVYGMLGIGLMLFCLRGMHNSNIWKSKWLGISFWCLNIGLAMMIVLSLLPQGLWQAYNSFTHGYWYARSPEVIHSSFMENLVLARVPGDIVFFIGVFALSIFMYNLFFEMSFKHDTRGIRSY